MEWYLMRSEQVTYAPRNRLPSTPESILDLVKDFNIDIRNSVYLILQDVGNYYNSYCRDSHCRAASFNSNVIDAMWNDAGIRKVMIEDYNECIQSVGLARLNNGDYGGCFYGELWRSLVIDKLLMSQDLQNVLYAWVKPEIARLIENMEEEQYDFLRSSINHMIDYTHNYNHRAEKTFYRECCNSSYGPSRFIDHRDNPYRSLEAWVYRRVEDGTMTASQINGWLIRIKQDMNL